MSIPVTPYSVFTIPAMVLVSYWPVFLRSSTLTKLGAYNNVTPRGNLAKMSQNKQISPELASKILRMEGAHQNGLENLPFFGLSVLAANFAGVDTKALNLVSFTYIGLRVLYNYIYINHTTPQLSYLRTVVWNLSMVCPFYMVIKAGLLLSQKA